MISRLNGKIKAFFLDGNVSYKERTFVLVLIYTILSYLIAIPCFAYVGAAKETLPALAGSIAVCLIFIFVLRKYKSASLISIVFCYFVNIISVPLVFIVGGGVTGGMEFLFLPAVMDAFILLSGTIRLISLLLYGLWYTVITIFTFSHPEVIRNVPEGSYMIISILISMLLSVYIALAIVVYQNLLLKDQRERVKEASYEYAADARTKSRFLANMSHELRTPMNAIIGMSELMEKEDVENAASEEIAVVKNTAESLLMTINDILTFSRLESGKLDMVYEQFSLDTLLSDLINEAAGMAETKGVGTEADIDPNIPSILYGDEIKIAQVLKNLLFNAIESTESGRVTLSLSGKKNREGNIVTISGRITDSGDGMSKEDLENIYSSYETYDSKKDSYMKKLGLELTICRGILNMMNGDLKYESLENVGSLASFYFDCFVADKDILVDTSVMGTSRVLVASRSAHSRRLWGKRLNVFRTVSDYAGGRAEFEGKLSENEYDYIFIDGSMFEEIGGCVDDKNADRTYVVTDHKHSVGDFGKCRIIRRPVTSLNLGDIFCDRWNEKEYEDENGTDNFVCRGVKILVVDDNRVNLQVAQALLAKYRITPIPADSGFAALHIVNRVEIDMILMDQVMPGFGGVETMTEMKLNKVLAKVPIICMSADSEEVVREDLIKAGFDEYLSKPVKDKQLEKILLQFLPKNKIIYKNSLPEGQEGGMMQETQGTEGTGSRTTAVGPGGPPMGGAPGGPPPGMGPGFGGESDYKPEIDMETAITMTGGDKDIYHAILNVYLEEGKQKMQALPKEFFGDRDIKLFAIDAHSVKGSSANIGAKNLAEIFKALEMAGKSDDYAYIEQNLGKALNAYGMTLDYIRDYLVSNNALERK